MQGADIMLGGIRSFETEINGCATFISGSVEDILQADIAVAVLNTDSVRIQNSVHGKILVKDIAVGRENNLKRVVAALGAITIEIMPGDYTRIDIVRILICLPVGPGIQIVPENGQKVVGLEEIRNDGIIVGRAGGGKRCPAVGTDIDFREIFTVEVEGEPYRQGIDGLLVLIDTYVRSIAGNIYPVELGRIERVIVGIYIVIPEVVRAAVFQDLLRLPRANRETLTVVLEPLLLGRQGSDLRNEAAFS